MSDGSQPGEVSPEVLTAAESGRRAAGGAALLMARGALILAVGLGANVALARMLDPRDFGLVAFGGVLLAFGTFFADGGLGSGLIRRPEAPSRRELEAVNGVQLGLTALLAAVVAVAAVPFGRDGLVVAVMIVALPITMLKIPSMIVLERRLEYGPIARVDVVEAVTFYVWAVATVALGAGVWGFATAAVARAVAGFVAMLHVGPLGLVRPRWAWREVRPLMGFAAKFQGTVLVSLVRDQTINVAVAAVAGVAALGVWNLAWRVLQIPFMVFGTIGRVAFPAMARMIEAGEDPRPVIERGGAAVAVLGGAVMVALIAFAPALPVILGEVWSDVPEILLWSGLAMIVSYPVVLSGSPYLFAADAGGVVLRTSVAAAAVWIGVMLALLPSLGAPAAAIGWSAGALVTFVLLGRETATHSGAAVLGSIGTPIVVGLVAAGAGWLVADAAGSTIPAGILGVAAGEALLFVALLLLRASTLSDTRGLMTMAIRNFTGRTAGPAQRVGAAR